MHGFNNALNFLFIALLVFKTSMTFWFRDAISEAIYLGNHTLAVQRGLKMGVALLLGGKTAAGRNKIKGE